MVLELANKKYTTFSEAIIEHIAGSDLLFAELYPLCKNFDDFWFSIRKRIILPVLLGRPYSTYCYEGIEWIALARLKNLGEPLVGGSNFSSKPSESFASRWGGPEYFEGDEDITFKDDELVFNGPRMAYTNVGPIKVVKNPVYFTEDDHIHWDAGSTPASTSAKDVDYIVFEDGPHYYDPDALLVESTCARDPSIPKAVLRGKLNDEALIDDEEVYLSEDETFY